MFRSLVLVLFLVGSISVHANEKSIEFAKDYLEEVLVRSYDNIESFIDTSAFTKYHELTIVAFIEDRFKNGQLDEEGKKNFKRKFIEMGIPEEDLPEWTIGDLVKYFYVDFYQVHSNSLQGATTENIEFLNKVNEGELTHYLFNVEQSIEIGEEFPLKQKYTELRTVTIQNIKGKPVIVPPNSLKAHVEIMLYGLVEANWKSANKPSQSDS